MIANFLHQILFIFLFFNAALSTEIIIRIDDVNSTKDYSEINYEFKDLNFINKTWDENLNLIFLKPITIINSLCVDDNCTNEYVECEMGFYFDQGKCEACPGGRFGVLRGQTTLLTACPELCPPNTWSPPASTLCYQCTGGSVSPEGSGSEDYCLCKAGNYKLNDVCTGCPTGRFSDVMGV